MFRYRINAAVESQLRPPAPRRRPPLPATIVHVPHAFTLLCAAIPSRWLRVSHRVLATLLIVVMAFECAELSLLREGDMAGWGSTSTVANERAARTGTTPARAVTGAEPPAPAKPDAPSSRRGIAHVPCPCSGAAPLASAPGLPAASVRVATGGPVAFERTAPSDPVRDRRLRPPRARTR